jgi:hypothetical protein
MRNEAVRFAVNFAILTAHRLGEPRVLELSPRQLEQLRESSDVGDWSFGPSTRYRDLRIDEAAGSVGRVLAWDRARETEMTQRIHWGGGGPPT